MNLSPERSQMTFGDHLEVLRRMLFRILGVLVICAGLVFSFKDMTFRLLLAPANSGFITYRILEAFIRNWNPAFRFDEFHIDMIATGLSSQFMAHISASLGIGALLASPFIIYEMFRFIAPALYDNERRYALPLLCICYLLFIIGIATSYLVIFPVSFRFLATYCVSDQIHTAITIDSYLHSFIILTLLMGAVFQLPVIAYVLGRLGIINSGMLSAYRRHALIVILVVSAVVTPPDIMTLILVALPLYMLYEISIRVV